MILPEQLVLLALDARQGNWVDGLEVRALRRACAAGVLAELVLHGRLRATPLGPTLASELPDFHPLLTEATGMLAGRRGPLDLERTLSRLDRRRLLHRLIDALVARDVLHEERRWPWRRRNPVRSMQALREVYARLHQPLDGPATADALALGHLADAAGLVALRLDAEEARRWRSRIDAESGPDASPEHALFAQIGRSARRAA